MHSPWPRSGVPRREKFASPPREPADVTTTLTTATFRLARTVAAASLATLATLPAAPGATKYFDTTAGAGNGVGGSGTLAAQTTALFSNVITGDAALSAAAATDDGVFQGTAGTVTLGATFTLNSAAFNVTGYTLTPDATTARALAAPITLAAGVNLNLDDANATANRTLNLGGSVTGGTGATLTIQGAQAAGAAARINLNAANATVSVPTTINQTGGGVAGFVATATGTSISGTISNNSAGATILGATSGNALSLSATAVVSGSAGLRFGAGDNGGAGVITLNAQNTYAGATTFNAAVSGTIRLGVANALPTGTDVTMAASASNGGVLDLNGFNQTIGSLTSGAGGGGITNGNQAAAANSLSTLTINGAASPAAFALNLTDGTGATPGKVALTRGGTGTTTLSGTGSTYSGGTSITGGKLLVANPTGSATGTGGVSIGTAGTLASGAGTTGAISGLVSTVGTGSTIAPGATAAANTGTVGALTLSGGLNLANGATIPFDLGASSDLIAITGGTFTGGSAAGSVLFNFNATATTGTFVLVNFTGATANGVDLSDFAALGANGNFSFNGSELDFTLTAVPEPGTVLAGLLALGTLGASQRRRWREFLAARRRAVAWAA